MAWKDITDVAAGRGSLRNPNPLVSFTITEGKGVRASLNAAARTALGAGDDNIRIRVVQDEDNQRLFGFRLATGAEVGKRAGRGASFSVGPIAAHVRKPMKIGLRRQGQFLTGELPGPREGGHDAAQVSAAS